MTLTEWTLATLKELFDREFAARDEAVRIALTALERRLEHLNEAHAAAKEKESTFLRRDVHDAFTTNVAKEIQIAREWGDSEHKRLWQMFDAEIAHVQAEIDDLRKPKWPVWIATAALILSIGSGLWFIAITPIKTDLDKLVRKVDQYPLRMESVHQPPQQPRR